MKIYFTRFFRGSLVMLLFFCGLILGVKENLNAQNGAWIYYAMGSDFALNMHGEYKVFPVTATGVALERTGIVNTGPGTLLEMQLLPSGTVIKLSDNTSLIYNGTDPTGRFEDLGLLYGRIRIVTGSAANPTGSIVVRCGGVSIRLNAGDFGFDYLVEPNDRSPNPRPFFNFYAFRGSAEVFPYGMEAYSGNVNAISVTEGESLFMDISSYHKFAEKRPIDKGILAYWNFYNFTGSSPGSMPNTEIVMEQKTDEKEEGTSAAVASFVQPDPLKSFDTSPPVSYRGKNIILGIGIFLTASAALTQVITHPQFGLFPKDKADITKNVFNAAYVPLGMGVLTTIGGIIYNPAKRK